MINKPLMNLKGAMDLIKKSDNSLRPLYEAITNSLEAVATKTFELNETPRITISLNFSGLVDECKDLVSIEIRDNGIGFTAENYNRFSEFFNKTKGYNNRGTGRLQFYHRFNLVMVESVYFEDGSSKKHSFSCNPEKFIYDTDIKEMDEEELSYTHILMSNPKLKQREIQYFDDLEIADLAHKITQTYLLRFYLDDQKEDYQVPEITLVFKKNNEVVAQEKLWETNIPKPSDTGSFTVSYSKAEDVSATKINWVSCADRKEEIKWAHFKIPSSDLDQNGAFLCSKDIAVEKFPLKDIKVNDIIDEHRYLTVFYGDIFDAPENVSDTVDSFNFPDKRSVERKVDEFFFDPNQRFLFIDDITAKINSEIPNIYKDLFTAIESKEIDIRSIARSHGIAESIIARVSIGVSDNEETITKKLYEEQSRHLARQGYKVKQVFVSLNALNPTAPKYQEELAQKVAELSNLVDKQNKEELSRYVLRREMVADVLKKILDENLDVQNDEVEAEKRQDREGLIHDLIFKRKTTTNTLNDLWVLNEEFLHFDGTSDLPLLQIENENGEKLLEDVPNEIIEEYDLKFTRRPDVYLFGSEGKCIIIELKATNVDVSDYLNQMPKYCTLIANYSKKPIKKFYCYLVGETFNPITDLNDYDETVSGDWIRQDMRVKSIPDGERIATQQIEIIKLSSLYARAHRRNKSFADKLGVRDFLEGQ